MFGFEALRRSIHLGRRVHSLRGGSTARLFAIALVVGAAPAPALAFAPSNGFYGVGRGDTHQDITEKAVKSLYPEFFGTTRQTKAMKKALKQIVDANADVDPQYKHVSAPHFDGENFSGGQEWIFDRKDGVLSALHDKDAEGARRELGQALHTLQDYYSHSNWIELGNSGPNPVVGQYGATPGWPGTGSYCTPCTWSCDANIVGDTLTSGFFGGQDKVDLSGVKCRHGGIFDSGAGPSGGINKDTLSDWLSPHYMYHAAAAAAAQAASVDFIRTIRDSISTKQLKLLFGVGPTLAMAVDTTCSMVWDMNGVISDGIAMVDRRLDTDDEPLKYVLSEFNDPSVGPVTVTDDPDAFKAALGSLVTEGSGGDCPEYSMYGLLNAIAASDEDAEVFLFTDASPKDGELAGAVSTLAEQKHIKVYEALFGTCYPYPVQFPQARPIVAIPGIDPAYSTIAERTGGQLLFTQADSAEQLLDLMESVVGSDVAEITAVSEPLSGEKLYTVPVDSALSRITLSISLVQLDSPALGDSPVVTITRPDGTVVTSTDPGVRIAALSTSAVYTITSPPPGTWTVSVSGSGALSLKASGQSSLHFDRFDFVRAGGSDEHPGLFPIPGLPPPGQPTMAAATISGDFLTAKVELRTESADPLLDLTLAPESGGAPGKLFGQVTLPASTFVVYATGTDSNGFAFQRVIPRPITPQTVEVLPPSTLPVLTAGESATYVFTVNNSGPDDTFRFTALDTRGFGLPTSASTIVLASGATADVTVTVTVPGDAAHGTVNKLLAMVESTTGTGARNSALVNSSINQGATPRVVAPQVRDITATGLTLEWTAPIFSVTSYSVARGTTSTGPWGPIASGIVVRTVADSGLTANTTYYYRLGAVNSDGVTVWSSARAVTTSPPAPGTPTLEEIGDSLLTMGWSPAAGATTYKLERAPDVSGTPGAWAQTALATHYLLQQDYGLDANTVYWYRVRAWNGVSDGPYSPQISVMTLPEPPGVPTFSDVGTHALTVNWTAPDFGAASYKVERALDPRGTWTQVAAGVTTLSYTDPTVAANSTYWYRVFATNARGLDGFSRGPASVTTPVDPSVSLPGAPGAPTYDSVSTSSLSVNWAAATGAVSYVIERAPDVSGAPGAWAQIASGVTALTYLSSGLTANTAYWYRVRATNAGGEGPYSGASGVITLPNAPGAPTFSNVAYNTVPVNWTAPTGGAASFKVERGSGSYCPGIHCSWTQLATGLTALTYTDATVAANGTYAYRVGATNAAGTNYSDGASVTTPTDPGSPVPTAPGTPTYTNVNPGTLWVHWTAAVGAVSYDVERAPDVSGAPEAWTQIASAVTDLSLIDWDVTANTAYWYRVRATNGGGDGPYSDASEVMTPPNAPGTPTFTNVAYNAVTVNWTVPTGGAASCKVERATSAIGPWTQIANGVTALSQADMTVAANVTYWYRVRATNLMGLDGNYSSSASVTTPVDPSNPVPGAPGTPTYTNLFPTSFRVNWAAATDAVSYKVERAPDASGAPGAWAQIASGVAALYYNDSGRTANTAYWYRIRATNGSGDGPYSAASSVMTPPNAPGTPTFTGVSYNTVTVNWAAPGGGAASYKVDRATSSTGPWTSVATGVTALSFVDATVAANVTYWYRVRATNVAGLDGSNSTAASVSTPVDPGTTIPGAPGTPTYTSVATTYVTANWTAATGALSYKVERAPDASGAPGAWAQVASGVTALSYSYFGGTANTAYWYRVRGTNAGGDGPYSTASTVMTLPNAPGTPTFTNVAYNAVTVNWTAPAGGAASYKVERATTASGPWTQIASGITALSQVDTTVLANVTYWYRARATNLMGLDGSYSTSASVTTPVDPGNPVPGAPGTPTYTNLFPTSLRVNWAAATDAVSYKVERAPDASGAPGTWAQIASAVTALYYNDSGRTANTAYWYRVRATNGSGDGPYSTATSVMTPPNVPGTPTFTGVAYNTVTVNWAAPSGGAASYKVDRATSSTGPWTSVATGVTALSFVDATVAANVTYWYRIRGTNLAGLDGNNSTAASVTTPVDPGTPVPGAPGAPMYSPLSTTYLTASWTVATGATSYKVERAPDGGGAPGAWAQLASGVTTLSYADFAVTANTAYWYRVRGTNGGGDGPYSTASTVMTLPNAPGTPTFTNVVYSAVTVNWAAPTGGAASYKVERSTTANGPWTQIASGVIALGYGDSGLAASTVYYYRVRATNAQGRDGSYSASASVTTSPSP